MKNRFIWFWLVIIVAIIIVGVISSKSSPQSQSQNINSSVSQDLSSASANLAATPEASNTPITPPVLGSNHCQTINNLPDPKCTPGVTDPRVTQANIQSTICVSGYTKTVRPPVSYTDKLKIEQIQEYGYTDTNTKDYEEDHFVPLKVGGSPSDPKNLWPEPGTSPNKKDGVENLCHSKVCSDSIGLVEAQKEIEADWHTACGSNIPESNDQTKVIPYQANITASANPVVQTNQASCSNETALCNDGTCSNAASHQGACSHHEGVAVFYR